MAPSGGLPEVAVCLNGLLPDTPSLATFAEYREWPHLRCADSCVHWRAMATSQAYTIIVAFQLCLGSKHTSEPAFDMVPKLLGSGGRYFPWLWRMKSDIVRVLSVFGDSDVTFVASIPHPVVSLFSLFGRTRGTQPQRT